MGVGIGRWVWVWGGGCRCGEVCVWVWVWGGGVGVGRWVRGGGCGCGEVGVGRCTMLGGVQLVIHFSCSLESMTLPQMVISRIHFTTVSTSVMCNVRTITSTVLRCRHLYCILVGVH